MNSNSIIRVACLLSFMILVRGACGDELAIPQNLVSPETFARLDRKLRQTVRWEFGNVPLDKWAREVSQTYGLSVHIDKKALDAAGISSSTPISANLHDVSLGSAIRLVLRDLDLEWAYTDDVLLVTTQDETERRLVTIIYPVEDLISTFRHRGVEGYDFQSLIDVITNVTGKPSPGWDADGGVGRVEQFSATASIVVSTTLPTHRQIAAVLAALRRSSQVQGVRTKRTSSQHARAPLPTYFFPAP